MIISTGNTYHFRVALSEFVFFKGSHLEPVLAPCTCGWLTNATKGQHAKTTAPQLESLNRGNVNSKLAGVRGSHRLFSARTLTCMLVVNHKMMCLLSQFQCTSFLIFCGFQFSPPMH